MLFAALLGILAFSAWQYNCLVRGAHRVAAGWSDIDVQLKRRHDLLPKLVTLVRAYADHERETHRGVIAMRTAAQAAGTSVAERARAEAQLGNKMQQLLACAEAYPQLKADALFLEVQANISQVEEMIQRARRYYNGTVNNLNVRVASFPSNLVARAFRFWPAEYFEMQL